MTFGTGNPRILGVPGGGLNNAAFLRGKDGAQATARVGKAGEVRTASILNALAEHDDGPTVMHDLMVPSGKYKANIDHIVISGRTVHIIDAKVWKPAFYWTTGATTRRGAARFEPAEKKTMIVARNCVEGYLRSLGIDAKVIKPTLVIWPSSTRGRLSLWALRVPGAHSWHSSTFERRIEKMHGHGGLLGKATRHTADPNIVAALTPLLVSKPRGWNSSQRLKATTQQAHERAYDEAADAIFDGPPLTAPSAIPATGSGTAASSLPLLPDNPAPNRTYQVPDPVFETPGGAVSAHGDPIFGEPLTPPKQTAHGDYLDGDLPSIADW